MKRFLIADDDTDDLELFCEALTTVDPEIFCDTVTDGSGVLAKLKDPGYATPDLVVLDINMPNVNGWTALKAIRAEKEYRNVLVFIYSTSSNERDKLIAKDLGADDFFTKPETFQDVVRIVETLVDRSKNFSAVSN